MPFRALVKAEVEPLVEELTLLYRCRQMQSGANLLIEAKYGAIRCIAGRNKNVGCREFVTN
mgnify:CR=1 FL=1